MSERSWAKYKSDVLTKLENDLAESHARVAVLRDRLRHLLTTCDALSPNSEEPCACKGDETCIYCLARQAINDTAPAVERWTERVQAEGLKEAANVMGQSQHNMAAQWADWLREYASKLRANALSEGGTGNEGESDAAH